jgi:hypothetical protein
MTTVSTKFAYLPNAIIREIIAYTGATFKKRNEKYMGQIPRNDPRYALLLKVPPKTLTIRPNTLYTYFCSTVVLSKDITLNVGGLIFNNNVTYVNHTVDIRDICNEYVEERVSFANDMKSFEADMDVLKNDIIAFRNFLIKLWICSTMFLVVSTWQYIRRRLS